MAVPRVAGVLLYTVTAFATFCSQLRAFDEESGRRRTMLVRQLRGLRSARALMAIYVSDETLRRIDEEMVPVHHSLHQLMAGFSTRSVRWTLRVYEGKPVRAWPCWTPVVGWLVSELRRKLDSEKAFVVAARLFNASTIRPLNAAAWNPFFDFPPPKGGRWPFHPAWQRNRIGPQMTAEIARSRYYQWEKKRRREHGAHQKSKSSAH